MNADQSRSALNGGNMIRRAANLIGTGDSGFVLSWYVDNQPTSPTYSQPLMVFEDSVAPAGGNPGVVTIQPAANIRFSDGSPATIPELN
jgi:hypothetical protein